MEKLLKLIDFKYVVNAAFVLASFVICLLFLWVFNIDHIPENSLIENSQLVVLAAAFILCIKMKSHKALFRFGAMVIFLMFMRELSYGRCIFSQLPDNPHEFYPWSHYKYGWLAHVVIGIYIVGALVYAAVTKIWIDIKNILEKTKFPFWDFVVMAFLTGMQYIGEKILDNTVLEETAELSIYVAILALTYYFYKKTPAL